MRNALFPAHAGMTRETRGISADLSAVPRTRGDDQAWSIARIVCLICSPHMQRCLIQPTHKRRPAALCVCNSVLVALIGLTMRDGFDRNVRAGAGRLAAQGHAQSGWIWQLNSIAYQLRQSVPRTRRDDPQHRRIRLDHRRRSPHTQG